MIWNWFEKFPDLFKREVPKTEVEAMFQRMDVDQFFNGLSNIWAPSELIRKIGGHKNLELLYKDSEIYAAIDKRIAALLDTRLVFEGDDQSAIDFFVEQILPHEQQLKQDFWWTVYNGYGVEQIIYHPDRSCKVIGFQREEFWRFEPLQDLIHARLIYASNPSLVNKVMPYGKWIVTTNNGTYFNPIGEAMAERLIQPWIFRCNGWDLWMDFAKRFANGFMHAQISDPDKQVEVRRELEKAAKSAIIVTDKDSSLNMIQASRDSTIYDMIDSKTIASMQKVILGETQTSEMQIRGSSASAEVHNEVRLEKTRADIRLVEGAINEAVRQIGAVCGMDMDRLPKAKLIYDPGLNAELANRDAVLSGQIKFTKKYYVNNYGFKEDEFEVVEQSAPSFFSARQLSQKKSLFLSPEEVKEYLGAPESTHVCRPLSLAPNVARKEARQEEEKEETVSFLNRNAEQPINIDDILAAINLSKNQKELDANLIALFDNRSSAFADTMTDALYYAATKGALLGNPEKVEAE